MQHETIAAIATAAGGGVGIVRISGKDAINITESIFHGKKSPQDMPGYTGTLGKVHDAQGELDEAVLFVYRAPHSYTGEDCCELSCHGSSYILQRVLAAAVAAGARPAGAGEFTRRALLNGKLTLTQAEAVAGLVAAEGRQSARAALEMRDGLLWRTIDELTEQLTDAASHITAWIDYPEEDVEDVLVCELSHTLQDVQSRLAGLITRYDAGRVLREGISTAIVGRPNVGKSTLMNLLAGCERSIVTEIAGTTRDVIEDSVRLGEIVLRLSDTAGIHNTLDPVEKIGVARSVSRLEQCDLILAIFDGSQPLNDSDVSLLERLDGRLAIGIINKCDLPRAADAECIARHTCRVVSLSAKEGGGVDELSSAIAELAGFEQLQSGGAQLINQRQLSAAVLAVSALEEAQNALSYHQTLDAVSVCMEESIDHLLELTGKRASAEVIDRVFEKFCVGK